MDVVIKYLVGSLVVAVLVHLGATGESYKGLGSLNLHLRRLPEADLFFPTSSGSTSFKIGIDLKVELNTTTAIITMTGPEKEYFAVGFNATRMRDRPYTIYVNSDGVHEQQIGTCGDEGHCGGKELESSVNIISKKVVDNQRTVVMSRSAQGRSQEYYSFGTQSDIPMIAAVGHSDEFSKHKDDTRGHLALN